MGADVIVDNDTMAAGGDGSSVSGGNGTAAAERGGTVGAAEWCDSVGMIEAKGTATAKGGNSAGTTGESDNACDIVGAAEGDAAKYGAIQSKSCGDPML